MDTDQYRERAITTSSAASPDKMPLRTKGILNIDEIDPPMRTAEANLAGDERLFEDVSPPTVVSAYFQPRARRNPDPLLLRVGSHDRPE